MPLNKQSGNMYSFVSHTWNPIKGKCQHDCNYCYMKRFPQKEVRLVESELQTDLGKNNFIFVGSSTDLFAKNIPREWIQNILHKCLKQGENTFLFQSKNPERFKEFLMWFPSDTIFGTTIETNRECDLGNAPMRKFRHEAMKNLVGKKMVSIEPIMDFDLDFFSNWLKEIQPEFVSIGADSKGHKLAEPSKEKIQALIKELKTFTRVIEKNNLKRLVD